MKKCLLFLFFLLTSISNWAYDAEIDGIYYNLNSSTKTAEVTSESSDCYSGDVVIPEKVIYEGSTYNVTSIGDEAFYGCGSLTSVTIPNSVTSIGDDAFHDCFDLTKAEFASIESLCKMEFKGFDSNPLSHAHHLYIDGKEVTDVTIPESVTSIGDYAFQNCSGLTSITIGNSVKSIGSQAFYCCNGLTNAEFASIESLCKMEFKDSESNPLSYVHHLYIDGKEVTDVTIPESVTSIGSSAFSGCSGLTSITIPNSVTSIGSSAFSGCSGLTSVTIPNSVTEISSYVFSNCSGLTTITIPNSVTSIGNLAFYGCSGLTSVTIPASVTSIGSNAFYNCSNLSLVISEAKNPTIESSYVFYGIASNAILSIPPFSEEAYKDCIQSFADYTTDLKVGSLYFNLDDDGDGTAWVEEPFLDRKPYSGDIVIPSAVTYEGVEYPVVGIDDNAFKDAKITSVVIPDGVKYIDGAAFYNCENLTSIVIPKTVRSIGESAFMYCDEVEALVCLVKNPFPISGKGAEGATFSNYFFNNVPLYVPKGTAETYRETEGWKDFANIVEGLPDGIEGVVDAEGTNTEWYDLGGCRQSVLHHGINLLRMSNGTVKKVIVK